MRNLFNRTRKVLICAVGGGMFLLSGCDTDVRDTVLGGVESASGSLFTAFLSAFFQSLEPDPEGPATTIVRGLVEVAPQIFT